MNPLKQRACSKCKIRVKTYSPSRASKITLKRRREIRKMKFCYNCYMSYIAKLARKKRWELNE